MMFHFLLVLTKSFFFFLLVETLHISDSFHSHILHLICSTVQVYTIPLVYIFFVTEMKGHSQNEPRILCHCMSHVIGITDSVFHGMWV